jgi:hypothetical protein
MVQEILLDVDFNGIVLFDYPAILSIFDGKINNGQNILDDFTKTDKGDVVLNDGIVLPIMGIYDGSYLLRLFINERPNDNRKIIFCDEFYYLNITGKLYIADMAVFWDWEDFTGWQETEVSKGTYEVCLEGVRFLDKNNAETYSYDLTLRSIPKLLRRTIEPRSDSRLER